MKKRLLLATFFGLMSVTATAWAQNMEVVQRSPYAERESRSRFTPAAQPYSSNTPGDAAGADARISQLEEQIRRLNGKLEEMQYKLTLAQTQNQQYQESVDRKLGLLEQRAASALSSMPPVAPTPSAAAPSTPPASTSGATMAATAPAAGKPASAPLPVPENAKDHYNQAFQLLNQANFKDARVSLESFVQKYPDDALVGNAYYWLGETHYVERGYPVAADNFRKGYEKLPTGPKAPDNLLKLGMSLQAMSKSAEACVVYDQIFLQFPNVSSTVRQKVEQEKTHAQCKKKV
jgi:tol-pal system protein YbgF